jgi:hypothetical protein
VERVRLRTLVIELQRQGQAVTDQRYAGRLISLKNRQMARRVEGTRACWSRRATTREQAHQPAPSLRQIAAHLPESPRGAGERQASFGFASFDAPANCGRQVGVFVLHSPQPGILLGPAPLALEALHQIDAPVTVSFGQRSSFTTGAQSVRGVLADCLEQTIARVLSVRRIGNN